MKTFLMFSALSILAAAESCLWDKAPKSPDAGISTRIDVLQRRIELLESKPAVEIGRYQLNRLTPPYGQPAMLLDTATGQTWIICRDAGAAMWCNVPTNTGWAEVRDPITPPRVTTPSEILDSLSKAKRR